MAMLIVAANQIPNLDDPLAHFPKFAALFTHLQLSGCRNALLDVLDAFAARVKELDVVVCTLHYCPFALISL